LDSAAGYDEQGVVEACIDVAVFNGEGISLLQEEHHEFGIAHWLSDRLAEIGNSLFGFCDLQRAISLHIRIQAIGDDFLAILHRSLRIRVASVEKCLVRLGESVEIGDKAKKFILAQLANNSLNG
jgi:hypothetical protein